MLARAHNREMHSTNGNIECRYSGEDENAFETTRTALTSWKPGNYVEVVTREERLVEAGRKMTSQTVQKRVEDRGDIADVKPTRHICILRQIMRDERRGDAPDNPHKGCQLWCPANYTRSLP